MRDHQLVPGWHVRGLQHILDLVKRHAEVPEPADYLRDRHLTGLIEAVAGCRIDLGRFQQPDVVVVP